jgi:exodeoxyribonuclease VIII
MTTHLMLDLETFATTPDAMVIEVAAILFDPLGPPADPREHVNLSLALDPTEQIMWRRAIDPATVDWWETQPITPGAKAHESGHNVQGLAEALREMIGGDRPAVVWANSPSFDCVILRHLFRQAGAGDLPWHFRVEHDCRTIRTLAQATGWVQPLGIDTGLTAHAALDDCTLQARRVQSQWQHLMAFAPRETM